MAEGRGRLEWGQTAALLALLANAHRDPRKGRPLTPADFDPYARRGRKGRERADFKGDIGILKAVFVDGKK